MSDPIVVDDNNFDQIVLQAKTPVLVDLWATWCAPCRMVEPVIEEETITLDEAIAELKISLSDAYTAEDRLKELLIEEDQVE